MPHNPIVLVSPAFFALIGVELWLGRRRGRRDYRLYDAIANVGCGLGQQTAVVFLSGALVYGYLYERFALYRLPAGSPWVWAACFFAVDLAYYWSHRMSHEVGLLWAAHAVHHQSEDYNLSVALRQGWLQRPLFAPFYWPLAVVGFPPAMFAAMYSINILYQFWIHTQLIDRLGPLEWVLNTPSHHRVHHGADDEYLDRNHGGVLIVWDRLFGTFRAEGSSPRYGVVKPLQSWSPLHANIATWADLARRAASAPRLLDKLRVLIMPPDWHAPGARAPVEASRQRTDPGYAIYDVRPSPARQAAATALFVATLAATVAFLRAAAGLDQAAVYGFAACIFAALAAVGALLDRGRSSAAG